MDNIILNKRNKLNELALFSGSGGGLLASKLLGWNTICAVENRHYAIKNIHQRQRDGVLDRFPVWDDITTFDPEPFVGLVDVISGGFPCQDASVANSNGEGIRGKRTGLWSEYVRAISAIKPKFVFAENVPNLRNRGFEVVIKDLWEIGYVSRWIILGGAELGAYHKRDRLWVLAYPKHDGSHETKKSRGHCASVQYDTQGANQAIKSSGGGTYPVLSRGVNNEQGGIRNYQTFWDGTKPELLRMADDVANRVDRFTSIGNGQIPIVAATAFKILSAGLK